MMSPKGVSSPQHVEICAMRVARFLGRAKTRRIESPHSGQTASTSSPRQS